MIVDLVDVIEVQIKEPHTVRVMGFSLTERNAEAFIKMAVIRRGVDNQFYMTAPVRQYRDGDRLQRS